MKPLEEEAICITCNQNLTNCECPLFSDKEFKGYQGRMTGKQELIIPFSTAQERERENLQQILDELQSIEQYMKERDAFHGYGQITELSKNLEAKIQQLKNQ